MIERRQAAPEASESEPEAIDETPVIMRYLQGVKTAESVKKQTNETEILQKDIIESSLKEIKYDIEALKNVQKEAGTDVDNITLKSESGETKVARDMLFGTPDLSIPSSEVPCGGCGALLHCQDTGIPGFMPQETFKGLTKEDLQKQLCQRCTMLKDHDHLIHYGVDKQMYSQIVKKIRSEKALVLMVIDVTDMENSVIKEFLKTIGERRPVYIIGNKIDLIPKDQKGYMNNVAIALIETCLKANLNPIENNIRHVCLVSAKTGYGIEDLITKLMNDWEYRGLYEDLSRRTTKPAKWHVHPAKTQISLGICPVWSEFTIHMKKASRVLSYPLSAQWRLWSDWADAQADLSLCRVHMSWKYRDPWNHYLN